MSLSFTLCNAERGFRIAPFSCSVLSPTVRAILRTPPEHRTAHDLQTLSQLLGRLKCFQKYSAINKLDLLRILHYDCFPADARILRQGLTKLQ